MKRLDISKIKKNTSIRHPLVFKGSRFGTSSAALTALSGPTSSSKSSGSSASKDPALFRILLHGMYIGHHFDGGFRGGTGEFYWYSSVADGNELSVIDSRQAAQFGNNGILTGVDEKTWLDFGLLELFRSKHPPARKNIVFSFSLKESDDGDEAKSIFKASASVARTVANQFTNSNLADAEKRAVNLFNAIIDADDDDDAIQGIRGLDYLTNYSVGRFIRIEGKRHDNRPTFAIFSIVPLVDPGTNDFAFYKEGRLRVEGGIGTTKKVDIPQNGSLSIMMRVRSSQYGVSLTGPKNRKISSARWTVVKTIPVKKGKFPIHLRGWIYPSYVDLCLMFTSDKQKAQYV